MHIGRNERCPCGSGKKFKACHLPRLPAGVQLKRRVVNPPAPPPVSTYSRPIADAMAAAGRQMLASQ